MTKKFAAGPSRFHCWPGTAALFALVVMPASILASELDVGLGVGLTPEFEGSKHYQTIPLPAFEYDAAWGSITTDQLGVAVDVVPSEAIDAGPVVRYLFGRNDDIDAAVIHRLPHTDDTLQAGLFVQGGVPVSLIGVDDPSVLFARLEGLTGIEGEDGSVLEGSVGVSRSFTESLTLTAELGTTLATRDYMRSFFEVTPAGSSASGLPVYSPSGGFKDIGLTLVADQDLTERWSVELTASYSRLVGDAADSPIVREHGSPDQLFAGLTVSYRFW